MPVAVKHRIFGRARFHWLKKFSFHEMHFMECSFLFRFPGCRFRPVSDNCGCVIHFDEGADQTLFIQLKNWISDFLEFAECQGPPLPPSKTDLLIDKVKGWTAQLMIVLAILGWILPILPGTPFFLIAWWLGWRPSSTDQSVVAEPKN